jgi:UDP-N-acetylglucosamine/UDP-N-acetylgalactosamine diphosphorylase
MLAALAKSGGLAEIRRRGIQQLFYLQVDNPLAPICDPAFIGYHLLSASELSTLVVAKHTPQDRVGNFVSVDGHAQIIEYSDLPAAAGERRNPDGSLTFWAGSIGIHVFETSFLERMVGEPDSFPFHIAKKKVPFIDAAGQQVDPREPNAIKFERFIFDLVVSAKNAIAVEADENENFKPVKNASGAAIDTREIAQAAMIALHTRWLEAAGAKVDPGVPVEISPLFALDAAEVAAKLPPGLHVTEPTKW